MSTLLITKPLTRVNDRFSVTVPCDEIAVDFKDAIVEGKPNHDFRVQAPFYKKIGVDIVAETVFEYPYPFLTEKTYRPIASLRPFILVGPYMSLAFLKSIGFKTFSTIIDEGYDDIKNPDHRFSAVCDSIKKFIDRPLENIKQDLQSIKDDLLFNQRHLANLTSSELENFKKQI